MKTGGKFLPAKAGELALKPHVARRCASLNLRANLEPVYRFNDGVFIYRLDPRLRKMLNVSKDNPGVAVILE